MLRPRQRMAQQAETQIGVFVTGIRIARRNSYPARNAFSLADRSQRKGQRRLSAAGWTAAAGKPECWVPSWPSVISLPPREGILKSGSSWATGVSNVTRREHGLRQQGRGKGLGDRADFINSVAVGRLAVIKRAEGHNLAVVAVHNAEHQRLMDSGRDTVLRRLFHALG